MIVTTGTEIWASEGREYRPRAFSTVLARITNPPKKKTGMSR